jgi:hypothetical protein
MVPLALSVTAVARRRRPLGVDRRYNKGDEVGIRILLVLCGAVFAMVLSARGSFQRCEAS